MRPTEESAMSKHVILATEFDSTRIRYFLGYRDDRDVCEARWTADAWKARWIDAAEAAVEVKLLAEFYPGLHLKSWSLDTFRIPRSG
jgi:hypothetical protein